MAHYLLSMYQPEGEAPPELLARVMADLDRLRADLKANGSWVFAGGLHGPGTATVLRPKGEEVLVTDGPFTEAKEHLGGFTVIDVPDIDAALEWGRRYARATTLPIEVRPFRAVVGD